MLFERKTRDRNWWHFLFFPLGVLVAFFLSTVLFDILVGLYLVGGVMLATSILPLIIYRRTRNAGFLVVSLYLVFGGLMCVSTPTVVRNNRDPGIVPIFLVGMYVSGLFSAYLLFNRKLKWRGQEILELAAMPVEDTGSGFTSRPRPAGKVPVSKTEMIRFVDFVQTHLIAFPFREENRVVFVLTVPGNNWPYLLGLNKDYLKDTWVAIDFDGNISVNITEEDYLLFKQDLAFDQLCQSLGNVFAEFLELSKQGQEEKIVDRMDALRLSPFTS